MFVIFIKGIAIFIFFINFIIFITANSTGVASSFALLRSSIFSWMSGRLCRKRVLFAGEKSPYAQSSFVINLPHPEHYWKFARCRKLQSFLITPNTPVKFVMLNETWIEPLVLWAHLYKFGNVMEIFFFANLHKKCNLELFL